MFQEIESSLLHGESPELFSPEKKVDMALDYLMLLAEDPTQRDLHVVTLSETIVDVFYPNCFLKEGRESSTAEVVASSLPVVNLGGGANVIRGIAEFSQEVVSVTRIGMQPPFAPKTKELFAQLPPNVRLQEVLDYSGSNSVKIRYEDKEGRVLFAANTEFPSIQEDMETAIINQLKQAVDGVSAGNQKLIISDYGRGICTPKVLASLSEVVKARPDVQVFVDPRPGSNIAKYDIPGAVLKPNRQEAEKLSGRVLNFTSQAEFDQSARLMASDIFVALPQIHGLLMTLDTYGCVYISVDGVYRYFPGVLPDRKVINPSGAGDIVVSTLCLLANEFEIDVALNTAMWLAGYSVTQAGTSTLTKDLISQVQADRKMFRP